MSQEELSEAIQMLKRLEMLLTWVIKDLEGSVTHKKGLVNFFCEILEATKDILLQICAK